METKFKVGDRVRMIDKHASYDADNGSVGTVAKKYGEGTDNNAWEIDWDPDHTGGNAYAIESQLELVHARGKKVRPVKFALQYEFDDDPTEYFATLPEVKARLKELSSNSLFKRGKIFLHTLSKTQRVELGTSITIRKA